MKLSAGPISCHAVKVLSSAYLADDFNNEVAQLLSQLLLRNQAAISS